MIKQCICCGENFYVRPSHASKRETCSIRCRSKVWSKRVSGKNHFRWKSIKSPNKVFLYKKFNGMYEHRYVMEQYLGRKLLSSEIVHHINDDPKDNRIDNLQILTRIEHIKLHEVCNK